MNGNNCIKKIVAAGIFSLFVFLVFLNTEKTYQTETEILIIGKNPSISENIKSTVKTIQHIAESYSFYKGVEETTGGIDSIDDGMPEYKQKELWNDVIEIKQMNGSSVFVLKNFDKNGTISRDLNTETVKNLILNIGKYYNIKTDLDIRIIDGPITQQISTRNITASIAWSIILGILFYLAVFLLAPWFYLKKIPTRAESSRKIGAIAKKMSFGFPRSKPYETEEPYAFPQNSVEKKSKDKTEIKQKKEVNLEKPVATFQEKITSEKKSGTPDNLPVSEEIPSFILKAGGATAYLHGETSQKKIIEEKDLSREATPEEVKERLNRLLGGGL